MQSQAGYRQNLMVGDQCYPAFELRNLLGFIEQHLGQTLVDQLCQQIGIGLTELESVQFVYVWQVEFALEALRLNSADPDIGAKLGASYQVKQLDVLQPHLQQFSDLNQCLQFVIKHPELVGSFTDSIVRVENDMLWIRWLNTGKSSIEKYGFQFQHSICSLVSLARQLTAQSVSVDYIHIALPETTNPFLAEFTGAAITYDCEYFEWAISLDSLDLPLSYQFDQADMVLAPPVASLIEKLLSDIRQYFPKVPTLSAMASKQHMSDRTLRRKLAASGTSYQKLVDQVRCQHAIGLILQNQLSIEAIAEQLGYSDPSNFRQSFKHWVGYPPGHFLRLNRND
ncbi:helix-turn-helix domain-containing protein [Shewanella maritima]|uniref:helix-turn-helix domain-containing protein n=1 Tax=Shewanella maritima TaxID=2520507 RepID=UPI003736452C